MHEKPAVRFEEACGLCQAGLSVAVGVLTMGLRTDPLPSVIMAGSDRKPVPIPGGGEQCTFLVGYKGADVRIDGRPLIQVLRDRMLRSGGFSPVLIAGPRRIYEPLAPGAVIDTDGDLGHNLRRIFRTCRWADRICLTACDVVPTLEEFQEVLGLWHRQENPDIWFPLVEVPEDLGSSGWKPRYGIRPAPGEPPKSFLPGHLAVLRLKALRRRFLCKLASLLYRLRNRELEDRRRVVTGFIVGDLLGQDLMNLLHFRLPTLTWKVLSQGWRIYSRLRKGTITLDDFQYSLRQVVIRTRFRRSSHVVITPTKILSLARDLDTMGEVTEAGGAWVGRENARAKKFG